MIPPKGAFQPKAPLGGLFFNFILYISSHPQYNLFRKQLVLQTEWEISDCNDVKAVLTAKKYHNEGELLLAKRLRAEGIDGFIVGASGCALCSPCAFQEGKPCHFPDDRYSCMSAHCVFVKDLAEKCGMDYSWKEGKLSFYGMYVFD